MIQRIILICCLFLGGILTSRAVSPLQFIGSIPSDNSEVSSFDEIIFEFDLQEVISEYGGDASEWGISCQGLDHKKTAKCKALILYKGDSESGEIIHKETGNIFYGDDNFEKGSNKLKFSIPGIEVESGQKYTLVFTYVVFAAKEGCEYDYIGQNSFVNSPITINLVGAADAKESLQLDRYYDNFGKIFS